ncbi:SGNH hydrolase, partial [Schizophyllum amplum]
MYSPSFVAFALTISSLLHYAECAKVYLAGDSTMAPTGSGAATAGWGPYLAQFLTLPVVNNAVSGRSARSYTEEGRFTSLINAVGPGDYVVIEFGHNDGPSAVDNGRQDGYSDGYNDTNVVYDASGKAITIHSFNYYIKNAVRSLQSKGAIPIVSSQTPNNYWVKNTIIPPPHFVPWAAEVAGNTSVTYVDHYHYVAQAYEVLGQSTVKVFYPNDPVHTSPTGAKVVAQAFVRGVMCSNSTLKAYVNHAGQSVPNGCL